MLVTYASVVATLKMVCSPAPTTVPQIPWGFPYNIWSNPQFYNQAFPGLGMMQTIPGLTSSSPPAFEPTTSSPAISEPSTSSPAVSKPSTSSPAISEPSTSSSTVSEPATSSSAVSEPSISSPTVSEMPIASPTVSKPSTSLSAISKTSISSPAVSETPIASPTVSKPTTDRPAAVKEAAVSRKWCDLGKALTKRRKHSIESPSSPLPCTPRLCERDYGIEEGMNAETNIADINIFESASPLPSTSQLCKRFKCSTPIAPKVRRKLCLSKYSNQNELVPNISDIEHHLHDIDVDMNLESSCKNSEVIGRRLVNLCSVLNQIKEINDHNRVMGCTFSNMILLKEIRHGLISKLILKCNMCNLECSLNTDTSNDTLMDVNRASVAGAMAIGIGHSQLEEFFSAIEVPSMSYTTYSKHHDQVSKG
ncbi:mucin-5AC-like isoform X2 [Nilaparvata lugens]|uniref:mucin-5AC-like isoform X2 n=1 Tax=Nilaparvata lugens TaxID=108931 RepID=UPI00193CF00A|nr:mucin-5AC-like isoform X2 [Nilaparvata lugens]